MTLQHHDDEQVIDVRTVPRPQRHPLVFRAFDDLAVGAGLILVNDHEPTNLRREMEEEFAEALGWEPLSDTAEFRVRISRRASTAVPRIVGETGGSDHARADSSPNAAVSSSPGTEVTSGSVWQLRPQRRSLDANVIALTPGDEIREHVGPDLDVLIHVLSGTGTLTTELTEIRLEPGQIVWLPRRSHRRFVAGDQGLRYFSVHQRKQGLSISSSPPSRGH
ncbi:DUF2249 domain-containing protein [Brevibacterium sp.]|uniref:DUF2249 domain-containing protein n=1 Tax=Brevibacterium sp. TaxID=1701 RepID=UPI002810F773|nr:DUF2249 domain-containing protein [Brevibacterium sp.]